MKKLLIVTVAMVGVSGFCFGATTVVCNNCYKCVLYSGTNCLQCEYDEAYCGEQEGDCSSDEDCPDGMICTDRGTCEYGAIIEDCLDGEYFSDEGCVSCPEVGGGVTTSCSPHSKAGGISCITSCYYSKDCQFTDETGTFVLTGNCAYVE